VNDIIAGAGQGGRGRVRVFDGAERNDDGTPVLLYELNQTGGYRGGVYVASGDVNGDGLADIIVSPSAGSRSQVTIFDGADGSVLTSFRAFGSGNGGVRVAAGDVNGDGRADVIVGSGLKSAVRVFDGDTGDLLRQINAFGRAYRGGVHVASGDVDGDGRDDIIVGAGQESKLFRVFESDGDPAYGRNAYRGAFFGVRVGVVDAGAGDGIADIITAKGPGSDAKVRIFEGGSLTELLDLTGYNTRNKSGLFVG
jgi:hypothetical protein